MAALDSKSPGNKRKRSAPRIDMTPMVDLAFLLLTFFVMTTTLMKHRVIEMEQPISDPVAKHKDVKAENLLNVVLGKNDKIYWYMGFPRSASTSTNFSSGGVRKLLLDKKFELENLHVFIKTADESRYQNTIDMLDEMTITEILKYNFVPLEDEDKKLIARINP